MRQGLRAGAVRPARDGLRDRANRPAAPAALCGLRSAPPGPRLATAVGLRDRASTPTREQLNGRPRDRRARDSSPSLRGPAPPRQPNPCPGKPRRWPSTPRLFDTPASVAARVGRFDHGCVDPSAVPSTRRSSTLELATVMTAADTTTAPTASAVMAVVKSGVPPPEATLGVPPAPGNGRAASIPEIADQDHDRSAGAAPSRRCDGSVSGPSAVASPMSPPPIQRDLPPPARGATTSSPRRSSRCSGRVVGLRQDVNPFR
jgi:hypothetical protein